MAGKRGKIPQQERSKATVEVIVEATASVFSKSGFKKTTTAKVAERAGVSVGSLYQYFPDKEALITAFFDKRLKEDVEWMERVAARAFEVPIEHSPAALVRIVTEEMVALYRRDRALYVSVAEILPMAEQTPELRRGLSHAVNLTANYLRLHPAVCGDRDPELLALVLFHSLRTSLFRIVESAPHHLDDPQLVDILAGGACGFLGLPPR